MKIRRGWWLCHTLVRQFAHPAFSETVTLRQPYAVAMIFPGEELAALANLSRENTLEC